MIVRGTILCSVTAIIAVRAVRLAEFHHPRPANVNIRGFGHVVGILQDVKIPATITVHTQTL